MNSFQHPLNNGSYLSNSIVHRHSPRSWLLVVDYVLLIGFCFWFATSTQLNVGGVPRAEEIARHHADDDSLLVWMAFVGGTLLLGFLPSLLWSRLFFRFIADETGFRWRPFIEWESACWEDVSDCYFMNRFTPILRVGKRKIQLDSHSKSWPQLRDFIAESVHLPEGVKAWRTKVFDERKVTYQHEVIPPVGNDDAPIISRSGTWWFPLLGLVAVLLKALPVLTHLKRAHLFDFIVIGLIFIIFCLAPLLAEIRNFVRCDGKDILFGGMWRQRRIAFESIEDLFLDRRLRRGKVIYVPCILVQGETIQIEPLVTHKDEVLSRIERRAIYSSSRRFEKRTYKPNPVPKK